MSQASARSLESTVGLKSVSQRGRTPRARRWLSTGLWYAVLTTLAVTLVFSIVNVRLLERGGTGEG